MRERSAGHSEHHCSDLIEARRHAKPMTTSVRAIPSITARTSLKLRSGPASGAGRTSAIPSITARTSLKRQPPLLYGGRAAAPFRASLLGPH